MDARENAMIRRNHILKLLGEPDRVGCASIGMAGLMNWLCCASMMLLSDPYTFVPQLIARP